MKSVIIFNEGFKPCKLVLELETSGDAAKLYAIFNNPNITNTLAIDIFSDILRTQLKETGMNTKEAEEYASILNAQIEMTKKG